MRPLPHLKATRETVKALEGVRYVLLDLDGTLLDKHFDDTFWLHMVPERYSAQNSVTFDKAKEKLFSIYRSHERTLKWTDLDFWSESLGLDIPAMKRELAHLIQKLPHAEEFLALMREQGREVHLLTNAHHKSVSLKFEVTGIGRHFHTVLTSNELGAPKEHAEYWTEAMRRAGFRPEESVFIDDTEDVLRAAREFGIRHVLHKGRSSSAVEPRQSAEFVSITDFDELMGEGEWPERVKAVVLPI